MSKDKTLITIQAIVNVPIQEAWKSWTKPEDIIKWNNASEDWHTTKAENDLKVGGKFLSRMEAKDGSMGFDFWGIYDNVLNNELIEYTMGDGRKAKISFSNKDLNTEIVVIFEAEDTNPIELQRTGWQAILDNFKKYTEAK